MHQSRTWPHFPDHFVNFPHQGAAWVSASVFAPRPRKRRRTAHLSQNNARSNYITLSGKGAAGPASNLFALPPSLSRTFSTRLFQTFGLKVRNRSRVRKHRGSGGGKKREAGASRPKWRVFTSTLFSLPFSCLSSDNTGDGFNTLFEGSLVYVVFP